MCASPRSEMGVGGTGANLGEEEGAAGGAWATLLLL